MSAPTPLTSLPAAPQITRQVTSGGTRIYTVNISAFTHLQVNVFLIMVGPAQAPTYSALVDVGSSLEISHQGLVAGLDAVRGSYGEAWTWNTLSRIVITHPHPDHVGGLPFVRTLSGAPVAAHVLAVPTIEQPQIRRDAQLARVESDLIWAGVTGQGVPAAYAERLRRRAHNMMLPTGIKVDTALHGGELLDGLFKVIHVPGHEGAQISLQLDNIWLSADHLLPHNSPPLMPEKWHAGGGLGHYLASLDKIEALENIELVLGSHDEPMPRWQERSQFLRQRYASKLQTVLESAEEPLSIYDLTHAVNPRLRPVQALLLLDQTAALAEYLSTQGQLLETVGPDGQALFQRA